ncbi:SAM-dependent methyltransferase [Thermodesulfobacteriota bacterium]
MTFTLDSVAPWGRTMDEYAAMFALSDYDLDSIILGCADGPASFNAEMHAQGRHVVSVDPVYQFTGEQIRSQVDATFPTIMEQLHQNLDDYVWTRIPSPETLQKQRMNAMEKFFADFHVGKQEGRYQPHELPRLPFADQEFDLAVCSHFLFLYSDQLSADFHCQAVRELTRVAREVRIFPLQSLDRRPSPHVDRVCEHISQLGRDCEIKSVDYEFQRGANRMLNVR